MHLPFKIAFIATFLPASFGETSCPWFGWAYPSLDKELVEWPSAEGGSQQS